MKKSMIVALVVLGNLAGYAFAGAMSWSAGPVPASSHVILATTLVELYKDSGDSIFTWGSEGVALQTAPFSDFGDPAGYYASDTYNYGANQGAQSFWVIYHDVTGGGFYSVSQDGIHTVANDTIGNATDDWTVGVPSATWTAVAVPEPSTIGLLLVGAGLVAFRRMRRG